MEMQEKVPAIREQWHKLITGEKVAPNRVRPVIRQSWHECHQKGIDPYASLRRLVAAMNSVTLGDPIAEPTPSMSSQVSKDQLSKIEAMVEFARKEGAEVLCGGRKADLGNGYFYQPTVLGNCRQDMEVVRKEVFWPVLPVLSFADLDEAISMANDCEYGLTLSIYTANVNKAFQAINKLKFGETCVNRENFEAMQGSHAGWSKSGIGGADGKNGLLEYLQTHVAYIQY